MSLDEYSTEQLEAEVATRQLAEQLAIIYYCSQCGCSEEESDWGLEDVRVIVRKGEEGFADITQLLCSECGPPMWDRLIQLGFSDHRHGGINYLEAPCVPHPYENCPHPSEYGKYLVVKDEANRNPKAGF